MRHSGFTSRLSSLIFVAALCCGQLLVNGCAPSEESINRERSILRIKGSDTMLLLTLRWAEEFMRLHPGIAVYVEGGGTSTGIEALIEGDVDLCAASRTLLPDEVRRLLQKRGSLGISVLTAKDALSVYLHPENPVRDLSFTQLTNLFTGDILNWRSVSGPDLPVIVINRQPNSGTYLFFKEHVLQNRKFSDEADIMPSTEAVVTRVGQTPGAIGYGGLPYGRDLVHAAIDGVEPTPESVRNGSYPVARYLYLFAARPLDGALKLFVDWVLSNAGQTVVRDVGYIPLWDVPDNEQ